MAINDITKVKSKKVRGGIAVTLPERRLRYLKYKVVRSGWLCGYWNSGGATKTGFYRDVLIFVGKEYANCLINPVGEQGLYLATPAQKDQPQHVTTTAESS